MSRLAKVNADGTIFQVFGHTDPDPPIVETPRPSLTPEEVRSGMTLVEVSDEAEAGDVAERYTDLSREQAQKERERDQAQRNRDRREQAQVDQRK